MISQQEIPQPEIPPRGLTSEGKPRRVGVEIEFGGMGIDAIADRIRECVGGRIDKHGDYASTVADTSIGDVKVEFDAGLFSDMKLRGFLKELPLEGEDVRDGRVAGNLEKIMASAAATLVPYEVVFPPLEISRLHEIENIRDALRSDAQGTGTSIVHAFGLHLNPELPDTAVETILDYLRAFLCLYEELLDAHEVDTSRRIGPFIEPFPKKYVMRVLDPQYSPDLGTFIEDYLADNPTRNRPLDLLPILAWLNENKIREKLPEEKISKRPTLHYRLPDCRIDEPEWTVTAEWNRWARVEHLAASDRLATTCRKRLRQLRGRAKRPVIGVTGPDRGGFPAWLFTRIALLRAGAKAVRLRPGKFKKAGNIPRLDGLVLGGGADVDPGRYLDGYDALRDEIDAAEGRKRGLRWWLTILLAPFIHLMRGLFSLSASGVDPARDDFEQRCLRRALKRRIPVLGICRGAQLINIHFDGTLHRNLADFYGEAGNPGTVFPRKRVEIDRGTRLHDIIEHDHIMVNSLHNQAVDQLGGSLSISARDGSGVVQAIEKTSHPFVIGVQWHPEYLPLVPIQQKIFRELVRRAGT